MLRRKFGNSPELPWHRRWKPRDWLIPPNGSESSSPSPSEVVWLFSPD